MDSGNKKSDWDNYVQAGVQGAPGKFKLVGGLLGLFIAYISYDGMLKVDDLIKYILIIVGLLTAVGSFYSLFKKR